MLILGRAGCTDPLPRLGRLQDIQSKHGSPAGVQRVAMLAVVDALACKVSVHVGKRMTAAPSIPDQARRCHAA